MKASLLALVCFLLWVNPHHTAYLDDELSFQRAIAAGTFAFFPGYIGFLTAARLLTTFLSTAAALQTIAAFFASLSVATFHLWLTRDGLKRSLAALGTLVFATGIYTQFNAATGLTYTVEAFAFLTVGYCCTRTPSLLYPAAVILAIAGAFRPTAPFFLAPLFLFTCYQRNAWKPAVLAAALSSAWLIPTLHHFGGATQTLAAGTAQVQQSVLPSTLLNGTQLAAVNLLRFLFYLVFGAHILIPFALRNRAIAGLWLAPAALFYSLIYVAWPGYILGLLAGLTLLAVQEIATLRQPTAVALLTAIIAAQLAFFHLARPIVSPTSTAAAVLSTYGLQYAKPAIHARYQTRLRDLLASMHL